MVTRIIIVVLFCLGLLLTQDARLAGKTQPVAAAHLSPTKTKITNADIFAPPPPKIKPSEVLNATWTPIFQNYADRAMLAQCSSQSYLAWCNGYSHEEKVLTGSQLINLSNFIYSRFNYQDDRVDTWVSHDVEAKNKQMWYGDCDDLTSTTLELLYQHGHPLSKMYMLLVNSSGRSLGIDHIVAIARDDNGMYWVVGDTSLTRNIYPLAEMTYSPRLIARMDHHDKWIPATKSVTINKFPKLLD